MRFILIIIAVVIQVYIQLEVFADYAIGHVTNAVFEGGENSEYRIEVKKTTLKNSSEYAFEGLAGKFILKDSKLNFVDLNFIADFGTFNTNTQILDLEQNIKISFKEYDLIIQFASISFKSKVITTQKVRLSSNAITVDAISSEISDHTIKFRNVDARFNY